MNKHKTKATKQNWSERNRLGQNKTTSVKTKQDWLKQNSLGQHTSYKQEIN